MFFIKTSLWLLRIAAFRKVQACTKWCFLQSCHGKWKRFPGKAEAAIWHSPLVFRFPSLLRSLPRSLAHLNWDNPPCFVAREDNKKQLMRLGACSAWAGAAVPLSDPPLFVVPFGEGPRRVGGLAAVGCAVGCSLLCGCSHGDRQMGIPACRGDQTARRHVCRGGEHLWTGVFVRDLLGPQELGEAARFSTNCFQEILPYFVQNGDHSLPL